MNGSWVLRIALAAMMGCYAPKPPAGSPCDDDHPCPASLICSAGMCQPEGGRDAGGDDAPIAGCVPSGVEICGDGVDQDCVGGDQACAANDKPSGAIDVTAGGMFTPDLTRATDDLPSVASTDCAAGGREVFYQITLVEPQLFYFDTFGSTFDSAVRVFGGVTCTDVFGATVPLACSNDACGGTQSQLVATLPIGVSCLVVDQSAGQATGEGQLRVTPGGRTGVPLALGVASVRGDTCDSSDRNHSARCGEAGAKDVGYWFTLCPEQAATLDATTCNATTTYDSVLAVRPAGGAELVCNDDGADIGRSCPGSGDGSVVAAQATRGPGLFWLTVDGFENDCGAYQLDTNLR